MFMKVVNDDSVIIFIYRVDLVLNSMGGFIRGIYWVGQFCGIMVDLSDIIVLGVDKLYGDDSQLQGFSFKEVNNS